jgi:hypothetical protein
LLAIRFLVAYVTPQKSGETGVFRLVHAPKQWFSFYPVLTVCVEVSKVCFTLYACSYAGGVASGSRSIKDNHILGWFYDF